MVSFINHYHSSVLVNNGTQYHAVIYKSDGVGGADKDDENEAQSKRPRARVDVEEGDKTFVIVKMAVSPQHGLCKCDSG
jgi:hypothetical protein